MPIGTVTANQSSYLLQSPATTGERISTHQSRPVEPKHATSVVLNISQEALTAASKAAARSPQSSNVDFTHMSQDELQGAAQQLFDEGEISGFDMAVFQRFGRVVGKAGPGGEFLDLSPAERALADSTPKNFSAMLREQLEARIASPEALAFYQRMETAIANHQGKSSQLG